MNKIKYFLFFSLSILLIAYPFLVYFGLQYLEPRYLGLLILALLLMRFLVAHKQLDRTKQLIPVTIAGSALGIMILILNSSMLVRFNPVLINLMLLLLFAGTLIKPPSMIERFARLAEPYLPEEAIIYTRNVTIVWCIFFVFNAIVAAITTFYATLEIWTLYNGLIAYLLMATIFIIEYAVRQVKMKTYDVDKYNH